MKLEETVWDDNGKVRWGLCEEGGGGWVAEIDGTREDAEQIAKGIAARSLGLFGQIEASAKIDDLDEAIRPIQDILGVTDGFNASMFFSDGDWEHCTVSVRRYRLIRYAVYELGMLEFAQ